jgi:Luciferase-like monooxygenase
VHVAVELPAAFASAGEFLADARAYDAAGAEAVWLAPAGAGQEALEPLTLLAAVAVVTSRMRLVAPVPAGRGWPPALLAHTVATLRRLGGDRVALVLDAGAAPDLVEAAGRVLVAAAGGEDVDRAVRLGAGLVCEGGVAAAAFARAAELRGADDPFERWARVPAPSGRAAWRELLATYEEAGATGIVVAHAPNLLDILRNPEEDDRQDLAMAVG